MKESFLLTECQNNEYEVRKLKVNNLLQKGINPWPCFIKNNILIKDLKKDKISLNSEIYTIVGRIISIREHGKSIFITIKDEDALMQGYIKKDDDLNNIFSFIKDYLDLGDIISFNGTFFFTKTEELTVRILNISLLSKCLHFIPDGHTGLENIELRYRQRYLDLIVNDNVKKIFKKRTLLINYISNFFNDNDYIAVETPMLHLIPGGALAKPFITHHNALDINLYLRIAPELYLKRLVVGGFNKVYEINKNFRNEGVSVRHNPEFTMLEFYTAYQDYKWAMNFVEEILKNSCFLLNNSYSCSWNENIINFEDSFDRLTAKECIIKYTDISEIDLELNNIDNLISLDKQKVFSYEEKIFFLFELYAEKKLIKPTFLINFPISLSPLAKADPFDSKIASRFELFICGMEISNGYNELNNPFEQKERFLDQVKKKESGDDEAMYYDDDFIKALEYGMPPTVGVGIGIDRLCMILTGAKSIKDVILFPTMKKNMNE
jgi:lysyl-tRNA synthetase class 2